MLTCFRKQEQPTTTTDVVPTTTTDFVSETVTDVSTSVSFAPIQRSKSLKMVLIYLEYLAYIPLPDHHKHCGVEFLDHNDRHCLQRVYFGRFWPYSPTQLSCSIESEVS